MRPILYAVCVAIIYCLAQAGFSQDRRIPEDRATAFQRAIAARAGFVQEKPPPGRLISVEVVIADVAADGSEQDMTADKLAELDKAGKVLSLSRLHLAALENEPAIVQFGERVPVVTGRAFAGRGAAQEMVSLENLGTMVSTTARVDEDESILIELQAEQTRLAPAAAKAEGDDADSRSAVKTATITSKTTLRVSPGKTVVAGGKATKTDKGTVQTWILVSASAEAGRANAAEDTSSLKIFTVVNAQAENLASLIQSVFRGDDIRVGVDTRTNSLIVQGDAEKLELIYRLITRLDEPETAPQK